MAIVTVHSFCFGFRGRFGDLVYRKVGDSTIATPRPRKARFTTDAQTATRSKFQLASKYAKTQMDNAVIKELYRKAVDKKNRSPYLVAISDYMIRPVIHMINTSAYTGRVNQRILIDASDNFKVASVKIRIVDESGEVIEQGVADEHNLHRNEWIYITTANNSTGKGNIVVEVRDLAGNMTEANKGYKCLDPEQAQVSGCDR